MEDIVRSESRLWSVVAYLGPLAIWAAFKSREDEFIRFHAKQGIVLFLLEVLVWVLASIPIVGTFLWVLGRLVFGLASLFGMIFALNGEKQGLPIIDRLSQRLVL